MRRVLATEVEHAPQDVQGLLRLVLVLVEDPQDVELGILVDDQDAQGLIVDVHGVGRGPVVHLRIDRVGGFLPALRSIQPGVERVGGRRTRTRAAAFGIGLQVLVDLQQDRIDPPLHRGQDTVAIRLGLVAADGPVDLVADHQDDDQDQEGQQQRCPPLPGVAGVRVVLVEDPHGPWWDDGRFGIFPAPGAAF